MPASTLTSNNANNNGITKELEKNIKHWVYEISEKLCATHSEARKLAFTTSLWWEFLAMRLSFSPVNAQLYALVCVNTCVHNNESLAPLYHKQNILKLAESAYPEIEIYSIQSQVESMNLPETVNQKPLLIYVEDLLSLLPQTTQIRNVCLILLDAYNLQYTSIFSSGPKIAAAALSVARFWVLESEKWLPQYSQITGLKLEDFKHEWDQMYSVAYGINQKNLARRNNQMKEQQVCV